MERPGVEYPDDVLRQQLDVAEVDLVTIWRRAGHGTIPRFDDGAIRDVIGEGARRSGLLLGPVRQAAARVWRLRRALRLHLRAVR